MKYLKGFIYINNIAQACSEIPAYAIGGVMFKQIGLKNSFVLSYTIGLVGMIALLIYQGDSQPLLATFIMGSKFGIASAFNLIYLGNDHLFPITVVATAFGITNVPSRIATLAAPLVAELKPESIAKWAFIVSVSVALLTAVFIIDTKSSNRPKKDETELIIEKRQSSSEIKEMV